MTPQFRRVRVAHLVSHPIQYFVPLYRDLANRPEVDLTVYYYSVASLQQHAEPDFDRVVNWDIPLTGGYSYRLCGDAQRRPLSNRIEWRPNLDIIRDLVKERYDVLWLHGYANVNAWLATAMGALLDIPVMLREEQTLLTPRSRIRRGLKKAFLPLLFRHVCGLYIGENNRMFFEKYGTTRMYRVSYGVDNASFQRHRDELASSRCEIRARFGVEDGSPVILFTGKFVDKKQPLLLLEAFRLVRKAVACHLLLVGDGPLRISLEKEVRDRSVQDVHFAGFLNQTEMALAYTSADMLVLPSAYQETWGLVVNEGMNFGLPVILSDRVGCGADLVRDGENGYIFPSGDVVALASCIMKLVVSGELRLQFGARSKEVIQRYGVPEICDQIVQACLSVVDGGKTLLDGSAAVPSD